MGGTIKDALARRFAPVPAAVTDSGMDGLLFLRRLRVSELRQYLQAVQADAEAAQTVLLSLAVCDAEGGRVFDSAAEVDELLGDQWLPIYRQCVDMCFPEQAEKNSPRETTPPSG